MERSPLYSLRMYILLFFIFGLSSVYSASLDTPDRIGVLGVNQVNISCVYTLGTGETFDTLMVARKRTSDTDFVEIARFRPNQNIFMTGGAYLQSRAVLSHDGDTASVVLNTVECDDQASYRFNLQFVSGSPQVVGSESDQMIFTVEAAPLEPTSLTVSKTSAVTEYTRVMFDCRGNVGNPAGDFWWLGYRKPDGSPPVNFTDQADPKLPTSTPGSCTFTRTSILFLNLTRADNGIVVRCQAHHPTQGNNNLSRQTQNIEVFYSPLQDDIFVSRQPAESQYMVGSTVKLTCRVSSNPGPAYIWIREKGNDNYTGESLTLQNLQIEDTDKYTCIASNSYLGNEYNVSKSVNIEVVATTTKATTTPVTTQSTTSTIPGVKTDPSTEPEKDDKTTIIIVVCVVVGVIIIVVAIAAFIIIRRKRAKSEVEEPPEKPFNNHNMALQNTRPDLVSDEKKYPGYNTGMGGQSNDGLTYAVLNLDEKPRNRKPVAPMESTDYADIAITMPQV